MLEVTSLGFGYGKSRLFDRLDLRLEGGHAYGLLGLNGAGKTSLLKLMAGALIPAEGRVSSFGRDIAKREAACLADTAFVPEDPWLPAVKAESYLARYAVFRPAFDYARFEALRSDFALAEDKSLQKLSYGQRKKFALAAALASGAKVVLLDEPTNGLDIPSKMQFRKVLAEAVSDDRIIVVSTHQVRDLESLIDPVLLLDKGRLAFELGADTIAERLATLRVPSLAGLDVVHAERDALGWNALVAKHDELGDTDPLASRGELRSPDLELVFNAALASPERLRAAISGTLLGPYDEASAYAAGIADSSAERS
jgi:ABC-type multidrug transport system, ATPase component